MAFNPDTIAELKDRVTRTFPRSNSEIEAIFDTDVDTWLGRLSRTYPYWFLTVNPGNVLPLTFPIADLGTPTPLRGKWLDRGWLRVEEGVESYTICSPVEDSEAANNTFWIDWRIQRVNWVKEFNDQGTFLNDLEVRSTNEVFSFKNYNRETRPNSVWWESYEGYSILRFHPVPDDYYLFAVSFTLADSPSYVDGADTRNRWLTFAPEAAYHYCMLKMAEYFDEPELIKYHERELFGDPPRKDHTSIENYQGLLGDLQRESRRRDKQITRDIPIFTSVKQSVGRNGGRRRICRPGYYVGPATYP